MTGDITHIALPVAYAVYRAAKSYSDGGVPIHTHTALPVQYTVYPACISYTEGGVSLFMSGRSASRHRIAYAAHPYRYDGVAAVAVSAEANTGTPPCKTPMCLCTHIVRRYLGHTNPSPSRGYHAQVTYFCRARVGSGWGCHCLCDHSPGSSVDPCPALIHTARPLVSQRSAVFACSRPPCEMRRTYAVCILQGGLWIRPPLCEIRRTCMYHLDCKRVESIPYQLSQWQSRGTCRISQGCAL